MRFLRRFQAQVLKSTNKCKKHKKHKKLYKKFLQATSFGFFSESTKQYKFINFLCNINLLLNLCVRVSGADRMASQTCGQYCSAGGQLMPPVHCTNDSGLGNVYCCGTQYTRYCCANANLSVIDLYPAASYCTAELCWTWPLVCDTCSVLI